MANATQSPLSITPIHLLMQRNYPSLSISIHNLMQLRSHQPYPTYHIPHTTYHIPRIEINMQHPCSYPPFLPVYQARQRDQLAHCKYHPPFDLGGIRLFNMEHNILYVPCVYASGCCWGGQRAGRRPCTRPPGKAPGRPPYAFGPYVICGSGSFFATDNS